MELPMTFADFAATEARFLKHFRKAPPETWNEPWCRWPSSSNSTDEREGKFPYIWAVDKKQRLMRLLVTEELVRRPKSACTSGASCAAWQVAGAEAGRTRPNGESACAEELLAKISASAGAGRRRGAGGPAPNSRRWRHGDAWRRRRRLRAGLGRIAGVHGL
jgi:hypothetical protein